MMVFEQWMFDFGDQPVPPHTEEDTEWFDPNDSTYSVIVGMDNDTGSDIACWIDDKDTAMMLAAAYCRRRMSDPLMFVESVWIRHPDGSDELYRSAAGHMDILGSEAELRMAQAGQHD